MKYEIVESLHQFDGKDYLDLVLTFENGKKFILVPLCKNDSKAMKSYFYALLRGDSRK